MRIEGAKDDNCSIFVAAGPLKSFQRLPPRQSTGRVRVLGSPDGESGTVGGMTARFAFDAAVVGAGAVGLATALTLARRGQKVVVLEKESGLGRGVSSRSSEVVHAGLYYPEDSLRARFCVEGRRSLYAFLQSHHVDHLKCGKLVVAPDPEAVGALTRVAAQAERNGVEGLSWLTGDQARALEPELSCVAALHSDESGILDSHGFMLALAGEFEELGGVIALRTPFLGASRTGQGLRVRTGGAEPTAFGAPRLVVSSGLGAQDCAATIDGYPSAEIPTRRLGKGHYFRIDGRGPFQRLVYPPPAPGALGVHYTIDLAGRPRFGPDLDFVDTEAYDVDPARAHLLYREIRRYWPGLADGALQPDYAAIRPKIHGPGEPQPDFRIDGESRHGVEGLVTLFGIESPGLTCALAIGAYVADLAP